jgi:short-subunit dehydrogenase
VNAVQKDAVGEKKYGSWAIVTGSSRGIGKCFADALAARGKNVVLVARNAAALDEVAANLRQTYRIDTRVIAYDLSQIEGQLSLIERETAGLDIGIFIANAAISHFGQLHRTAPAEILKMLDINIISLTLLCHYFAKRFVERGGGGIIPVSSNGAYCMLPNEAAYAASKAYVGHLGEILHFEMKSRNVDVTTLFPPLVDTDMIKTHETNNERDFGKMPFGFGRKIPPALIAEAALNALGRSVRIHPPASIGYFMWIIRRLPDGVRYRMFDYMFAKGVSPSNAWR